MMLRYPFLALLTAAFALIAHMTVGEFDDPAECERVYNDLIIQRLYIGFDVDAVTVKYKTDDGIWDTWADIPLLGTSEE